MLLQTSQLPSLALDPSLGRYLYSHLSNEPLTSGLSWFTPLHKMCFILRERLLASDPADPTSLDQQAVSPASPVGPKDFPLLKLSVQFTNFRLHATSGLSDCFRFAFFG